MSGPARGGRVLFLCACAAGCGIAPTVELTPCAPREESCRQNVFLAVEQMRGQAWDPWARPPAARTTTLDQYVLEVMASYPDAVVNPATVPAVYFDPGEGVLVLVEGALRDGVHATSDLVHALVRGAQARELGSSYSPGGPTTDWTMLRGSLIEGEATLYATVAELRMGGVDPKHYDWNAHFQAKVAAIRKLAPSTLAPSTTVGGWLEAPLGAAFVTRAWLRDGYVGVNEIFRHPPLSFVELMLAFDGGSLVPMRQRPRCELSSSLQVQSLALDSLGAGVLYTYLASVSGSDQEAWDAALRWQGDDYWSLVDLAGAKATFWVVLVPGLGATPLGAELAARRYPPVLSGDHIVSWGADNAALAETVRAASLCPLPTPP